MATAWPATLPQYPLEEGYSDTPMSQKVKSTIEAGPAKQRRRFTKVFRKLALTFAMDPTQKAAFDTFYFTTLAGGTLPFTWVDPVTRAAQDYVFVDPEPTETARPGSGGQVLNVRVTLETR